MVARDNIRRRR